VALRVEILFNGTKQVVFPVSFLVQIERVIRWQGQSPQNPAERCLSEFNRSGSMAWLIAILR
jgi:hypothetical protein